MVNVMAFADNNAQLFKTALLMCELRTILVVAGHTGLTV